MEMNNMMSQQTTQTVQPVQGQPTQTPQGVETGGTVESPITNPVGTGYQAPQDNQRQMQFDSQGNSQTIQDPQPYGQVGQRQPVSYEQPPVQQTQQVSAPSTHNQIPEAIPQQTSPAPTAEPAVQTGEGISQQPKEPEQVQISEQEEASIKKEIAEENEKKKEETKEEMKDKGEAFQDQVIEKLFHEHTEMEFKNKKLIKEKDLYKTKYEEVHEKLQNIEMDDKRIAVQDQFRPLVRLLDKFAGNKDDKDIEQRLLYHLYDRIGIITGKDYRNEITNHYQKQTKAAVDMSKPSAGPTAFNAPTQKSYKPTGVVRYAGGNKRF